MPGSERKFTAGFKNSAHGRQCPPSSCLLYHNHWYFERQLCWKLHHLMPVETCRYNCRDKVLLNKVVFVTIVTECNLTNTHISLWHNLGCFVGDWNGGWICGDAGKDWVSWLGGCSLSIRDWNVRLHQWRLGVRCWWRRVWWLKNGGWRVWRSFRGSTCIIISKILIQLY